jgi:Fe-S cluster assembly protein SufD
VNIEEPIRLLTVVRGDGSFGLVRNLVIVEDGASATIVEEALGAQQGGRDRLSEVTEIFAAADSEVRYLPLQHLGREVVSHRTVRARLDRQARLLTVIGSFGGGSYKADLGVSLVGPGAESRMVGVCFGDGRGRADHHTVQDHVAGHTTSDIDFRVVLAGKARSAYTGLIRIAKDAPYCEAFQENRNLLLSEQARAESIPELEILTDEVRCKHGATAGPIDQDQLFYLASRGLRPGEATRWWSRDSSAGAAPSPGRVAGPLRGKPGSSVAICKTERGRGMNGASCGLPGSMDPRGRRAPSISTGARGRVQRQGPSAIETSAHDEAP